MAAPEGNYDGEGEAGAVLWSGPGPGPCWGRHPRSSHGHAAWPLGCRVAFCPREPRVSSPSSAVPQEVVVRLCEKARISAGAWGGSRLGLAGG